MELSNLVVTENGFLKEDFLIGSQWAAIIGIIDWTDGKYKKEWRQLKAQTWKLIQDENLKC